VSSKTHAQAGGMHDTAGSFWPQKDKKAVQYSLSCITGLIDFATTGGAGGEGGGGPDPGF
jgi:hypothetical protein